MILQNSTRFTWRFFWSCLILLSLCPIWTAETTDEQIEYFDGSTLIAGAFLPPVRHDELRGEGDASYLGKNEALEATLVAGWERLATEIDVSVHKIPISEIKNYYYNIRSIHGEVFYVENQIRYSYSNGFISKVYPEYTVTDASALAEMKADLEQAVQNALSLVSDNMSDLEKALVLHDFVCSNCEYDQTTSLSHVRDAYGSLVLKRAVCAGYAIGYAYLLRRAGVPVDYITADSMNHAWNAVFIDGEWYHVDVTWDDPAINGYYNIPDQFTHKYFLKSDTAIKSLEHPVWDYPLYACTSTRFDDYFWTDKKAFAPGSIPCFDGRGYVVSKTKNELYAYDLETGQGEKVLDLLDDYWNVWGDSYSYWTGKYYQLATFHGLLAISTRDSVLLCDPDTMTTATLTADLPDTGYCYGLWLSDGANLYAVIRQSPNKLQEYTLSPLPWVPVTQVTVAPAAQEYNVLNAGGTQSLQLSATVSPANASWQVLTWSSDNEVVATVDSQGKASISLAAPGTATIYATSSESISGQCSITVDYPPIAITVTASPEVGGQVSGGGVFDYGTTTTLTAIPAEDYLFSGWFLNDELVSSEASYVITADADADYLAVFTLKTYAVTTTGCLADKSLAARGDAVTVTATLPDGALVSDYDFEWNFAPSVEFTTGEGTVSFTMPAEAVAVTCVATLKTYAVTVTGCAADKETAARGETVTVTATFPEGALASDYDLEWTFAPSVEFTTGEGTASFEMPAEAVAVTCVATLKTYAVTVDGCIADKSLATRGEEVMVTATLPEGALVSDYDFEWAFAPAVEFTTGEGAVSFTMPDEAVAVTCSAALKTYAVTVDGCMADKETAARGESVTVTATLPDDALISDYDLEWIFAPAVEFTTGEGTASFEMPAEAVSVSCSATLKTYVVTVDGCIADKSLATRGEEVMVTATLPEGALISDYDLEWIFAPSVEFTTGEGAASFTMPDEAVAVTCVATLKTYAVTMTGCGSAKSLAARGETVTVTALLPEDALVSDYDLEWIFAPAVEFTTGDGAASFRMPAEAVAVSCSATLKTYAVTATGCAADKETAPRGETVTAMATLPEGALASDYDLEWTFAPSIEFTTSEGTVSFTMPAEAVAVSCVAMLKTYAVTANGCTADRETAPRGETVTVTALLPEDALISDYDLEWIFAPAIDFTVSEGIAFFTMPDEAVSVTCVATLKTYAVTANGCTADKESAARGEMVTITATLPEGTSATDFDFSWLSVPQVDFIEIDAGVVGFVMPASEIAVTCTGALDLYPVTVVGAIAKKSYAAAGEVITVTANLPEDALVSDYDFEWTFAPAVEFTTGDGAASFTMPAEAVSVTCVATLKTYAVTATGCTADKESAARSDAVTVTATLPEGALVSDYDFEWNFAPSVEFTAGDGTASFTMPAEAVSVNCIATLKTYAVTANGCTADKETAPRGETVTVTAILPDGALLSDYDIEWTFAPAVEFTEGEGIASFEMPAEAVAVTCSATLKTYAVTADGCTADKESAARSEAVTITATLPDGALVSDYDLEWTFAPSVEFTTGEGTASFEMPAEAVSVNCIATLKTYAVTANGCTADKETALRGETVTATAVLPEDALVSDYDFEWSSVPAVEFTEGESTASFEMPAEAVTVTCVATLKTYAVTTDGCTADKETAPRGETVTVTATLPEGALLSDYDLEWTFAPSVEFTAGEGTASFEMPAEAVTVTCVATLKTYVVTTDGCTADKETAPRGETVTVTAVLPEDEEAEFWDFAWSSVPPAEFTAGNGTASFTMPAEAVAVTCTMSEKPLENTVIQRVLQLVRGWNPIVLSLTPDEASIERLMKFQALVWDNRSQIYTRAQEFSPDGLYWIYALEEKRVVVTGEAFSTPMPQDDSWQPYGAFEPEFPLDDYEVWQWEKGVFQCLENPEIVPGKGYFLRKRQ